MNEFIVVSPHLPQPLKKGVFTLLIRPSKRSRSPSSQSSPNVGNPSPKRLRTTSAQDSDIQTVSTNPREAQVNTILPSQNSSRIDPSQLHYPAMLLKKAKRKGLPIHEQFIHPGFFARHLDQKHPDVDFTILDYHEAWHYAVELARRNLDLTHVQQQSGKKRILEEGILLAHSLIDTFRLKTREEYAARKQSASTLWANADSERFQELLASKREKKRLWKLGKQLENVEMKIEHLDIEDHEDDHVEDGFQGFSFGDVPIRNK